VYVCLDSSVVLSTFPCQRPFYIKVLLWILAYAHPKIKSMHVFINEALREKDISLCVFLTSKCCACTRRDASSRFSLNMFFSGTERYPNKKTKIAEVKCNSSETFRE